MRCSIGSDTQHPVRDGGVADPRIVGCSSPLSLPVKDPDLSGRGRDILVNVQCAGGTQNTIWRSCDVCVGLGGIPDSCATES